MDKETLQDLKTVVANCREDQEITLYCKDTAEEFIIDCVNILNNGEIELTIKWKD